MAAEGWLIGQAREEDNDHVIQEVTMKKQYILIVSILLALLLAFLGCAAQSSPNVTASAPPASTVPEVVSPSPSITTLTNIEATLEQIYTQVSPSVVNIRVIQKQEVMFPA